ncbi:Cell division and transport-associated protein TolQ [Desulfacinum hydrothermale DSM 13146]|uniref:Cell division and transport-associated protein TolQ n=1 Tax=Desulfacinum hydrothermale DSM 13146 TaxID=1121390 RepID=A0A1W1X2D6_9BACT|nr:protein TolQ [Desulfacinum hydrothermale]SMC18074.1 Cell division and transport-associated protein TolQ [Desulfacinum hydrothermale DSM 13146]
MMNLALLPTVLTTVALASPYQRAGNGVSDMIRHAGPLVKVVLLLLLVMSLVCWGIALVKWRLFRRAEKQSEQFYELYRQKKNFANLYRESQLLDESYLAQVFRSGYVEWSRLSKTLEVGNPGEGALNGVEDALETVERTMEGSMLLERRRLERFLPFLATTGNTAPFIGLFGTVWGIMTSFQEIGLKGAANLAVVAPGISEALVATAVGLTAAIPAVVFYNHFINKVQGIDGQMRYFASDFYSLMKREWMRRSYYGARAAEESPAGERTGIASG